MNRLLDYFELFGSHYYWYAYIIGKYLGSIIVFVCPILFTLFAREAFVAVRAATNIWSWNIWISQWPVLAILIFWWGGRSLLSFLGFKQSKSEELYNSVKWMCEDIGTRQDTHEDIRCTIWVPIGSVSKDSSIRLIQAIDYFPLRSEIDGKRDFRKNGKRFRTYTVTKKGIPVGILGYTTLGCLDGQRPKIVYKETMNSSVNFFQYMQDKWNFSEFKARRLTSDRKSYACFPLMDQGERKLIGIVYLDASRTRSLERIIPQVEKYLPRFGRILTSD